jgi:hypothetical protein
VLRFVELVSRHINNNQLIFNNVEHMVPKVKRRPDCGGGIVWAAFAATEPFCVPFDVAALV